jgi:hypothetical protein
MRFMTMVKGSEQAGPPPAPLMEAITRLGREAVGSGVMVQMGGFLPSATGARVRVSKGEVHVTDGPFTDAKEVVGGYAVYDAPSRAAARRTWTRRFMELHREHWPGWEGETELRQLFEAPGAA